MQHKNNGIINALINQKLKSTKKTYFLKKSNFKFLFDQINYTMQLPGNELHYGHVNKLKSQ